MEQPLTATRASLRVTGCRLGGCGPVAVMRTGLHLGGSPGIGPAPTLPVGPRGRTSATASAHGGFSSPPPVRPSAATTSRSLTPAQRLSHIAQSSHFPRVTLDHLHLYRARTKIGPR